MSPYLAAALACLVLAPGCGASPPRDTHAAFARIQIAEADIAHASAALDAGDEAACGSLCAAAGDLCDVARELRDRDADARCERARASCAACSARTDASDR